VTIDDARVAELCARLVRARSENPPGREAEAAQVVARWARERGARVAVTEPVPGRPNVIARFPGAAPGLAFSGHTDVVPVRAEEAARWTRDPWGAELVDGGLWGRGTADMKGGLAAAMAAIEAVLDADESSGELWLLASMDEEGLMLGVKDMVAGHALAGIGGVVVCEPTSLRVAHVGKGRAWATLRVRGRTAHASMKGAGVNAVSGAARLVRALEDRGPDVPAHPLAGESFWAVTEIAGGIEPAVIPDRCELTLDVRLVPGQRVEDVWRAVDVVIAGLDGLTCEVEVIESRAPWELAADHPMTAAMAHGVRRATGAEPEYVAFPGTTDASYLAPFGLPCVVCGPGDLALAHREDEHVPVAELGVAARAYAHTAAAFAAASRAIADSSSMTAT